VRRAPLAPLRGLRCGTRDLVAESLGPFQALGAAARVLAFFSTCLSLLACRHVHFLEPRFLNLLNLGLGQLAWSLRGARLLVEEGALRRFVHAIPSGASCVEHRYCPTLATPARLSSRPRRLC
jgi:hypothetical protein